jgi:hypothetical protein
MKTNQASTDRSHPDGCQYALRREANSWEVTFEGQQATFKHELGALYVAYLLLKPLCEPIHALALALNAREKLGQPAGPAFGSCWAAAAGDSRAPWAGNTFGARNLAGVAGHARCSQQRQQQKKGK